MATARCGGCWHLASASRRSARSSTWPTATDTEYEVLGGLAGAIAAAVIDDSALSHVAVSERSWAPVVVPAPHGGATLGVAGSF